MIPTYEKDIICTYAKKQQYYKKINTGTYEKKKKRYYDSLDHHINLQGLTVSATMFLVSRFS